MLINGRWDFFSIIIFITNLAAGSVFPDFNEASTAVPLQTLRTIIITSITMDFILYYHTSIN